MDPESNKIEPAEAGKVSFAANDNEPRIEYLDPFPPTNWKAKEGGINVKRAYEWLNERHFVTVQGGKTWVANIPARDEDDLTFSSFDDFKKRYQNWYVKKLVEIEGVPTETKFYPSDHWLDWEGRAQRSAVVLDPRPTHLRDPYAYNLWHGFGVDRAAGDWSTIRNHLCDVVCSGDQRNYDWLVQWMAYCVQHPDRQAETAVVLRGLKGTGKGMAARILMRIFGRHIFHVTSPDHFVSRFNGHLMKTLFLFVDEGFWSGDKKNEGRLKALITESAVAFEGKYQPTVMMANRLKILMASNEAWVVPATADERRFFVLDVSDKHRGDIEYFKALSAAIDGPELTALLDYLLSLNLAAFDHRNPPHTVGLNDQKLKSLPSFDRFWMDCLYEGTIMPGVAEWPKTIPIGVFYDCYTKAPKVHYPLSRYDVGGRLAELVPGLEKKRPGPRGSKRPELYVLPPFEACRAGFLAAHNIAALDWDRRPPVSEAGVVGAKEAA